MWQATTTLFADAVRRRLRPSGVDQLAWIPRCCGQVQDVRRVVVRRASSVRRSRGSGRLPRGGHRSRCSRRVVAARSRNQQVPSLPHRRWLWDAARRGLGDAAGTRALVGDHHGHGRGTVDGQLRSRPGRGRGSTPIDPSASAPVPLPPQLTTRRAGRPAPSTTSCRQPPSHRVGRPHPPSSQCSDGHGRRSPRRDTGPTLSEAPKTPRCDAVLNS